MLHNWKRRFGRTKHLPAETLSTPRPDLLTYLVAKCYATPQQIEAAQREPRGDSWGLRGVLVAAGVDPMHVYLGLATELGQPVVDLSVYQAHQNAIDAVPADVARQHNVLPVKREGDTLYVAMGDTRQIAAADAVRHASRCRVHGVLAVPEHIARAISWYYPITESVPPVLGI